MQYAVSSLGAGFVLEQVSDRWLLCWDTDRAAPAMVPTYGFYGEGMLTEERPAFGEFQVIDARPVCAQTDTAHTTRAEDYGPGSPDRCKLPLDEHWVPWAGSPQYHSQPFREVTVDGVTWQVLLDGCGYPWVIQRKDRSERIR